MEETSKLNELDSTLFSEVSFAGEYKKEVFAINRVVLQTDEEMRTNSLRKIVFEFEGNGGFVEYMRGMEGDVLKILTIAYCSDHGCDRSTYYFSKGNLILKLDEESFWVGNQDEITENRTYFQNQREILCTERSAQSEGGYDEVHGALQAVQLTKTKCGDTFEVSSIDVLKGLAEENAQSYLSQ